MLVHLPLLLIAALGLQDSADPAPRGSGRFVPTELRAPVHYESVNGLIFFKANVAGREVWANLDTGAPTLIDLALTRSAGLNLAPGEEKLRTVDGEVALRRLSGEVAIVIPGQIETSHPRLAAVDMSAISKVAGREVRLVVGHDFLKPLALLIDPTRKVFQFAPSGAFRPPPGAVEVSLQGGKIPCIEVTVGNEKAIVSIDTGSMRNLALAADAWARMVPKDASTGSSIVSGGAGQLYASKSVTLPELLIGPLKLKDVLAGEALIRSEGDGLLGMGILGKFRLVLDIKQGKMWLGPAPSPAGN